MRECAWCMLADTAVSSAQLPLLRLEGNVLQVLMAPTACERQLQDMARYDETYNTLTAVVQVVACWSCCCTCHYDHIRQCQHAQWSSMMLSWQIGSKPTYLLTLVVVSRVSCTSHIRCQCHFVLHCVAVQYYMHLLLSAGPLDH